VTGKKSKGKPKPGLEDGAVAFRLEFGERMRHLLDLYDSRPDAAEVAGVTPEHLASYLSGKTKPPFELVGRLAKDRGVSLEWMATGEGHPGLGEVADGYAAIRVLEAESSSGPGSYPLADDVRDHLAFSRAWLQAVIRVPEDKLVVVFNRGHDNKPEIADGDALLVARGLTRVEHDGWHVFNIDGRLMTRFVRHHVDGRISLSTLRTESAPEFFSTDEAAAKLYGRVRWHGGVI
jgi:transcriptional regulator with XRE-family HTH domain